MSFSQTIPPLQINASINAGAGTLVRKISLPANDNRRGCGLRRVLFHAIHKTRRTSPLEAIRVGLSGSRLFEADEDRFGCQLNTENGTYP
jgi:hypothetical protein